MEFNHLFAFFNLCSREGFGSEEIPSMRKRALPIRDHLIALYEFAENNNIRIVSTQCIGQGSPALNHCDSSYAYMLPVNDSDGLSNPKLESRREIFIERPRYGSPEENRRRNAADVFYSNCNTRRLIDHLDVKEWIVFGVAMQACATYAVNGLLKSGKQVSVLTDTVLPSSRSDLTLQQSLNAAESAGARLETVHSFLHRASKMGEP